jgi:CheY-like chemotaxis protein
MSFRALLVTPDDQAAKALESVLSRFALAAERSPYSEALGLVSQQKFQSVLVDFDDAASAAAILEHLGTLPVVNHPVTIALLSDREKVRHAFAAGANFAIFKPVSVEQSEGALLAATALVRCERRSCLRVPVQVAIRLQLQSDHAVEIEGILLDVSESGIDVLAKQPLCPAAMVLARFSLPNSPGAMEVAGEVAWANPNGESGIRFTDIKDDVRSSLAGWVEQNARPALDTQGNPLPGCTLTDLSLGGCYIETSSPLPERTVVALSLTVEETGLQTEGFVRVMHPGRGMGVEFTNTSEQREQMSRFIQYLRERAGVRPELLVLPKTLAVSSETLGSAADDIEDPLLELLRSHEAFSEDTFLDTLRSQRAAEVLESPATQ